MNVIDLDLNQVRAILMIALLIGFLGICAWAWNSKRKRAFRDASMLPLEEDQIKHSSGSRQPPGDRE